MTARTADTLSQRRLRWRARRGLLENDLILARFLDQYGAELDAAQIDAFERLLDLGDNELLDLLVARTEPQAPLDDPAVSALLARLRRL